MSGDGRRRRCPVCWQIVPRTSGDNISRHGDSIGRDVCPASGQPYSITESRRNPLVKRGSLDALAERNSERARHAAEVAVERAREAASVILSARPLHETERQQQVDYLAVLAARAISPKASLTECAAHVGLNKDAFAGRLRRAFEYAQRRAS